MRIVLLTRYDPKDINHWSGTLYYMYQQLKKKHHIEIVGPELLEQLNLFSNVSFLKSHVLSDDRYVKTLSRLLLERISILQCDLIFFGDLFFQPLDANIPYIYLSDLIYEKVKVHIKPDLRDIDPGIRLEKQLLDASFKIIYCSEWIKNSAVEFYNLSSNKIEVVEFGANIPTPTNYSIRIDMDVCRLVFIGKNWKKKGGDKVLQAYEKLKTEGFPCSLTIIGSRPEKIPVTDKDLTIIPFLNKEKNEDLIKLCKILSEAHFLVLPTEFDAYGIVFCEASAYGVPSIATDVGGVRQPIREGKNGFLLPPDATGFDYAEKIRTVFSDRESYIKLRVSSRYEFETRLNWDVWGEKVNKILRKAVKEWKDQKINSRNGAPH